MLTQCMASVLTVEHTNLTNITQCAYNSIQCFVFVCSQYLLLIGPLEILLLSRSPATISLCTLKVIIILYLTPSLTKNFMSFSWLLSETRNFTHLFIHVTTFILIWTTLDCYNPEPGKLRRKHDYPIYNAINKYVTMQYNQ